MSFGTLGGHSSYLRTIDSVGRRTLQKIRAFYGKKAGLSSAWIYEGSPLSFEKGGLLFIIEISGRKNAPS